MYRFALRPRWLLSHLLVLLVIVACVNLGLWQLRRHDERAERNATVEARTEQPSEPVGQLLGDSDGTGDEAAALRYRPATASGAYEDRVLLVDNRSRDGLPGAWVLSPLVLEDGSVLVVNRGFQPMESGTVDPPAPPDRPVSLEGTLTTWDDRSCGVRTDAADDAVGMACLSQRVAEDAFGAEVLPVVLQRALSAPPEPEALTPVPLPELGSGPHRSYAAQWFIFGTIALVGYPLVLRRVARDGVSEVPVAAEPDLPRTGRRDADAPVG